MENGLSIIICCYNSSLKLPQTLKHIINQQTSPFPWEVIIVNNASTDRTAEVAEELLNKHQDIVNYKIITEYKAGLAHARNAGIATAKYEYIVFCDDDNWLCETYISTAFNTLKQNPQIGAIGGKGEAVCIGSFPDWFEADQIAYAVGAQAKTPGDVTAIGYLYGAGLVTRKSLYQAMFDSFPSLLIGRTGEKMTSGEDTEYCLRLVLKGFKLYYNEELRFKHFIEEKRLNVAYRDELFKSFRNADDIVNKYFHAIKITSKINNTAGRYLWLTRSVIKYLMSRRKDKKQKAKNIFFLLSRYSSKTDPAINAIKNFISRIPNTAASTKIP